MNTKKEFKTVTTLILNDDESEWLKNIMQNPLYGQTLTDESMMDSKMRRKFWNALNTKPTGNDNGC